MIYKMTRRMYNVLKHGEEGGSGYGTDEAIVGFLRSCYGLRIAGLQIDGVVKMVPVRRTVAREIITAAGAAR